MAEEESKFGLKMDEVLPLIERIAEFPHIKVCGLMTIAPFVENAEENRMFFRQLKKLSVDIEAKNINNVSMSVLSMGITRDYPGGSPGGRNYGSCWYRYLLVKETMCDNDENE